MKKEVGVRLREARVSDGELLASYFLEDSHFTSLPMDAMTQTLYEVEKHPIMILKEEVLVGFFILQVGIGVEPYTDNPNAILLRAYSIDDRYQGKGYGKESMSSLKAFVNEYFPQVNEVVLAVNHMNIGAQMLYLKSGFYDTKRRINGELGVQFVYSMDL